MTTSTLIPAHHTSTIEAVFSDDGEFYAEVGIPRSLDPTLVEVRMIDNDCELVASITMPVDAALLVAAAIRRAVERLVNCEMAVREVTP
jgi:hypothetical protein